MTSVRPRPDTEAVRTAETRRPAARGAGFVVLLAALGVAVIASLAVGARAIPPFEVVQILLGVDTGQNAMVIHDLRIPRTLIALVAGAALGVSGGLIQAVTRNPLADPGILGVNAGAAFALAIGTGLGGISGSLGTLGLAYLGAFVGALLLLGADLIAQHALPIDVPVGIVTVVLGGIYLLTLLIQEARRRS